MKNRYLLRVISGRYKGKGILSPEGLDVRPTSQRVKDSLFNIIRTELYGKDFLDIFSGTGQMGIEAVSNGAHATFVDADTSLVRKNVFEILKNENSEIIRGDFNNVLKNMAEKNKRFDFIFADPPYNEGLYLNIIECSLPLLNDDGVLILEHSSDFDIENLGNFNVVDKRLYGSRSLTFLGGIK